MTTSSRPLDVLCTGLIVADHVAAPIEGFPPAGALASTSRTELTVGGCAANVAVNLSKLGLSAGIVAYVGDDVLGRFLQERLEADNVDCRKLCISSVSQTAVTLVVNIVGEDRRFIHAAGANRQLTGLEVTPDLLEECRILYVGGFGLNPELSGENVARLFEAARLAGATTVLDVVVGDPCVIRDMISQVLPYTDVFLPNHDEAQVFTGLENPLTQARRFRELGAETVVVTCGAQGAVLVADNCVLRSGAYAVKQIDGTGGGDAFAAGFLLGLLEGGDPQRCLAYGAAMGASCVQSPGATTGTLRREELLEFVRSTDLAIVAVDNS